MQSKQAIDLNLFHHVSNTIIHTKINNSDRVKDIYLIPAQKILFEHWKEQKYIRNEINLTRYIMKYIL